MWSPPPQLIPPNSSVKSILTNLPEYLMSHSPFNNSRSWDQGFIQYLLQLATLKCIWKVNHTAHQTKFSIAQDPYYPFIVSQAACAVITWNCPSKAVTLAVLTNWSDILIWKGKSSARYKNFRTHSTGPVWRQQEPKSTKSITVQGERTNL